MQAVFPASRLSNNLLKRVDVPLLIKHHNMSSKRIVQTIFALALIGLGISTYSFFHNQGFAPGSFCTLGETFNCDVVNKGPFSTLMGIPVSLIGIIGYGFIVLASLLKQKNPSDHSLTIFLCLSTIGGMIFSLYLTSLEAFILRAWCLLCLTSQIVIAAACILVILLYLREKKS